MSFVRLKVKVELRKDIAPSDLPEVGDVLYLSFKKLYSNLSKWHLIKWRGFDTKQIISIHWQWLSNHFGYIKGWREFVDKIDILMAFWLQFYLPDEDKW